MKAHAQTERYSRYRIKRLNWIDEKPKLKQIRTNQINSSTPYAPKTVNIQCKHANTNLPNNCIINIVFSSGKSSYQGIDKP